MTDHTSDFTPIAESWDTYWHGAQHGAAYCGGGTSHPLVLSFWSDFFKAVRDQYNTPKIIDIASGGGAVVECAMSTFDGQLEEFTCLDISDSAISMLEQRFPDVHGIVADACAIPLDSASYDIVTSQFGIEYAGLEAIDEVARLIAPGGQLALLLHNLAGGIYRQCAASLDAIEKLQEAKFIPLSIIMFEEGFAAIRGADPAKYDAAAMNLRPAIRAMESIVMQHGKHVADGTIMRLFDDVKIMHGRMQHYEPSEVLGWLRKMEGEVQAYAGRMASMCNAAIDAEVFEKLCDKLKGQGHKILRGEALINPDQNVPLAWALVATKE